MVFWGLGLVGFGDADFPGVDVWCWDCFLVGCGLWAAGFAVGGFRIFGSLGCFGCISWEFVFEVLGVGLVFGAADRCWRPLGC